MALGEQVADDYRTLKLKLPARPGHAGDPGHHLVVDGKRVRIQLYVKFSCAEYTTNAAGWHGFIDMSTWGGRFKAAGLACTLLHELGHNLGHAYMDKTVDATYGRAPRYAIPGLPFPPGVPDGFGYGGKGHLGPHCATGLTDDERRQPSFRGLRGGCIMFGENNMNGEDVFQYCPRCRETLKATSAMDITRAWERR